MSKDDVKDPYFYSKIGKGDSTPQGPTKYTTARQDYKLVLEAILVLRKHNETLAPLVKTFYPL